MRSLILASALAILCTPNGIAQVAGDLDLSFNATGYTITNAGFQEVYQDVAVQADGKIVAVGTKIDPGFVSSALRVVRLNADGTPDADFGTNGVADIVIGDENYGYAVHPFADGSMLIAGGVSDPAGSIQWFLTKLDASGTMDISFALGGFQLVDFIDGNEDIAYDMTVQEDGKILLAGVIVDSLQRSTPAIYRFTDSGFLDMDFGSDGLAILPVTEAENEFSSIAVRPNGSIVASGHYSTVFDSWGVLVAQFDSMGVLDPSFGTGGYTVAQFGPLHDEAYGMALTDAGDIVLSGTTMTPDYTFDMFVGQFTATGAVDASFGTDGFTIYGGTDENMAMDCLLQSDGKILAGGTTGGTFFDNRDLTVWRFDENGNYDLSFNTDGIATAELQGYPDEINAIALQSDGKLVVAGKSSNGNENDFMVARFLTTAPNSIGENGVVVPQVSPNPIVAGNMLHIGSPRTMSVRNFELIDATGRSVASLPLLDHANLMIPGSVMPGTYFMRSVEKIGSVKPVTLVVTR